MSDERIELAKRIASGLKEINEVLRQNLPQPQTTEFKTEYKWVNYGYRLVATPEGSIKVEPVREEWPADDRPKT